MMMDDHKSGKKAPTSGHAKRANVASKDKPTPVSKRNSQSNMEQEQEHENDQPEMEDDESQEEQDDEIDLEAGNHIPRMIRNGSKQFQDSEMASGDTLSPLGQPDRAGSKRRVNDSTMDEFQNNSIDDPMRGPFRRKTSHDVSDRQAQPFFATSTFPTTSPLPSPSPFVPGSTFAKEEAIFFPPSFSQATSTAGSFLDQKYMSMFLNRPGSQGPNGSDKGPSLDPMQVDASSMLENFTTLDESMSSPPNHSSFLSSGAQKGDDSTARASDLHSTRASFTIPATSQPTFTAPFIPFTPVSNELISAPKMTSSFLDASQIQEFQDFKRQSLLYQQLQKGVEPSQKPIDPTPVPWIKPDSKDPYRNMRTALSQTTSPSSSAYIPIPMTLPEDTGKSSSAIETEAEPGSISSGPDAPLQPKKRGRPRKNATPSQASSPVLSAKLPSTAPSSPSLLPLNGLSAAQIILLQHRQQQQQQFQQHQQQLQQQQKQAILARQKPRVQKLVPSRGSIEGGAEITLLGSGFYPGMVPTFDGVPALDVQYYGPETMVCRLPPRGFPGTVVVKAPGAKTGPGRGIVTSVKDDPSSTDLVKTMAELFGGPSSHTGFVGDDDVGVLFEYEESKGDHDLIALALQVLGMKMSGRVEPPHQVAMRIMGTAAASNAIMGQGQQGSGSHSSSALSQAFSQPQQPSFLQFTSMAQATGQSVLTSQPRNERPTLNQSQSMPILTNGSMMPSGLVGYNSFLTSMSGGGH